jgi:hypothetical protein
MFQQARELPFKDIAQFEPILTPQMLAKIDAELSKL